MAGRLAHESLPAVQVLFSSSFLGVFMLLPLAATVAGAFITESGFSLFWLGRIFSDPFYFSTRAEGAIFRQAGADSYALVGFDMGVIPNTIIVGILSTLFATILGTTLALVHARYSFPLKAAARILLLVPMLSTPFVGAIGLRKMLDIHGPINTLFFDWLHMMPFRFTATGLGAMVLVQALSFYPIIFLTAYAAFISIDPTLEEQAETMGSKGLRLLRTVTLPLALPGIWAGAILIFILSVEDLGTPIVFAGSTASKTVSYRIFSRIFSPEGAILPEAMALSAVLLAISLASFSLMRRFVAKGRYAMLARGRAAPRLKRAGAAKGLVLLLFTLLVALAGSLPQVSVILLALSPHGAWQRVLPNSFTLENFVIISSQSSVAASVVNSLVYSVVGVLAIVIVGAAASYAVVRSRLPGLRALDALSTLPVAVPGVVLATGYFYAFLDTPLSPLTNVAPLIIIAYTVRKLPFTVRSVVAGLEQTHVALEEAAWTVGVSRLRAFFGVVLPSVLPHLFAGALLSFVYSMSEVSVSLVMGDVDHRLAPMTWKIADLLSTLGTAGGINVAAGLGVILMALQLAAIISSFALTKGRVSALTGV